MTRSRLGSRGSLVFRLMCAISLFFNLVLRFVSVDNSPYDLAGV
jgi:hypothetical protein